MGSSDRFIHDTGAYTPHSIVVPAITATPLPGPYRLKHYEAREMPLDPSGLRRLIDVRARAAC